MTKDEVVRSDKLRKPSLIERMLGRSLFEAEDDYQERQVDVLQVTVEQCFVPPDFNEEIPLYLLVVEENLILILFGQWLYDPNVLTVRDSIFDNWTCNAAFFSEFTLRRSPRSGVVFRLQLGRDSFVGAERLPTVVKFRQLKESQLIEGRPETVIHDLQSAGLVEGFST